MKLTLEGPYYVTWSDPPEGEIVTVSDGGDVLERQDGSTWAWDDVQGKYVLIVAPASTFEFHLPDTCAINVNPPNGPLQVGSWTP